MTPEQHQRAVCRDAPYQLFFPDPVPHGERAWREAATAALELCAVCPVAGPCRAEALAEQDCEGIRGGLTPPELRKLTGRKRGNRPGRQQEHRRHGTDGGYVEHRRRGETPCDSCREAHAFAQQGRRALRRELAS